MSGINLIPLLGFLGIVCYLSTVSGMAAPSQQKVTSNRPGYSKHQQRSTSGTSFTAIIEDSLAKITGKLKDPSNLRKFLNKYYFTGEKDFSVWPKAIQETEKLYGMDFSERDLADMQDVLRSIYKNILSCDEQLGDSKRDKSALRKHSNCYLQIYTIFEAAEVQFGLPAGSDVGQARMLSINIAFNLMQLLFLQMSQNLAIKAGLNPLEMTKPIIDTAVELTANYQRIQESANTTRLSAVSAVNVCTRVTIFYKDWDEQCQPTPIPYLKLQIAGGSTRPLFQRKIRVTVKDEATGEEICDLQETVRANKNTKETLVKKCEKQRADHISKLSKEMNTYFAKRTQSVMDALPLLWGNSKKKLKAFSEKLGTLTSFA